MAKFKARKVCTPGSHRVDRDKDRDKNRDEEDTPSTTPRRSRVRGRPMKKKRPGRHIGGTKYRTAYTQEAMDEAVSLVIDRGWTVRRAATKAGVPRMTLSDRMKVKSPRKRIPLGRRPELSKEVEEAIVGCLKMCADYQFPMRKRDVQQLVQAYCTEHNVLTRWRENWPGKAWIRNFRARWKHVIKLKKPNNIKRCRAMVSPAIIRSYMQHLSKSVEGVKPEHIFNYDETNVQDDPGN